MEDNRILKFVDSSYKECEVTGRDMGGDDCYEMPVKDLKIGRVNWPNEKRYTNHSVYITEITEETVAVEVYHVSRNSTKLVLRRGDKKTYSYMFGEWSYGYTLVSE